MYLEELFSLKGKVALVTGGGRGIGAGIAIALARAGADIAIFSRSGAAETCEAIRKNGQGALDIRCDVTDEQSVDRSVAELIAHYGRLDVVFNNAGICIHKPALEASVEEWRSVIDINLTGEYIVARAAAGEMIKRGIRGSIINMASMSGFVVNVPQGQASYNASKAAVSHMTRSLAVEWADHGIRVNAICPGYIATPMSVDVPAELVSEWLPRIPLGHRMGEVDELVPAILYLACDASSYTTGTDLIVDGGYTAI